MKIDSVDFFYLSMPEVTTEADGSQDALLVRVAAGGFVGYGECEAAPLPSIAAFVCPMSHGACQPVRVSVLGHVLNGPQDIIASHVADYQNRRNQVVGWLREAKGITCHMPEGAFYVFPNIAGCIGKTTPKGKKIETDTDFVTALLEERYVATVQGAAYGMSPYFRISYATDTESLREGCKRIQEFCADLK